MQNCTSLNYSIIFLKNRTGKHFYISKVFGEAAGGSYLTEVVVKRGGAGKSCKKKKDS